MSDGYLSQDRPHLASLQRKRRARIVRVDYMPRPEVLAWIEAKRATYRTGSAAATNSAVIDAIVTEWATLIGLNNGEMEPPMSAGRVPELCRQYAQARKTSDADRSACAQESGGTSGINSRIADARARAYDSGGVTRRQAANAAQSASLRVVCRARRHRDGQPCRALSEPGKRRCRFHGGRSTGPRTPEGRALALANLKQNRTERLPPPDLG